MRLAVFTDLDGTLLDHATYDWAPARPALDALRTAGVPLILASSKTAAEMSALHAALGLGDAPAIVENGAGVFRPGQSAAGDAAYRRIRSVLSDLDGDFRGFGDMSVAEVASETGLPETAAAAAKARCFSEPGLWLGSDEGLQAFLAALAARGITGRRGGRYLTLSFGRTKADAVAELARELRADATLALGDAPNDAEMVEAASFGVIVRNDHGPGLPALPGERAGRIRRTRDAGPAGWNSAVLAILEELDLN